MLNLIAEWDFSKKGVLSGSFENGDLILKDLSNNNNDLLLQHAYHNFKSPLEFKTYADFETIKFKNSKKKKIGQYFKTVASAPINNMVFENGFTIDVELKLPDDMIFDPWMGILTREGSGNLLHKPFGEKEILATLCFNDSFQWTLYPLDSDINITSWSCCADYLDLNDFISVTISNDGESTKLFLNGTTDIRNSSLKQHAISVVEGMGWVIGAALCNNQVDSLFSGELKRIRIYDHYIENIKELVTFQKPLFQLTGTNISNDYLNNENGKLVIIPDSQYMGQYKPEIVQNMIEWVAENKNKIQISAMIHVGDIAENSDLLEYENAHKAFAVLDDKMIPYMVTPGNHDYKEKARNFAQVFNKNRYVWNKSIEFFEDTLTAVMKVTLSKRDYLLISIDCYDPNLRNAIEFVKEQIKKYRLPAILFSHDIFYASKSLLQKTILGQYLWDELIYQNDEIFLVIAGHHFEVCHSVQENKYKKEVLQMLVNYQAYPNGGNGWLQIAEFDEKNKKIKVSTFSPWVANLNSNIRDVYDCTHLVSEYDVFEFEIDFNSRFKEFGL